MTGKDLKLKRVDADVRVNELADAMGVTPSRITHIENSRKVTPEAEGRYLDALSTCTTKSTDATTAA